MKKRCLHLRTSLTFKLDLSEALSQCRQMVVAYAGLALSPWGAGSEKLVALRHRSVSCFPLLLSNPECSTWGLQLCPGISVWKETQCVTRAYSTSFFWLYGKPLQQGVGILSIRAKGRSWRPIVNHHSSVYCLSLCLCLSVVHTNTQPHSCRFNKQECLTVKLTVLLALHILPHKIKTLCNVKHICGWGQE